MNEGLGSWVNPLSGTLGSGAATYGNTEFVASNTGNLVTDTGAIFVTDDGTEIIYAQ